MLLRMLEEEKPVDEIIFADTGKDFPEMKKHLEKVQRFIKEKYNKDITILKAEKSFDYYMFDHVKVKGKNQGQKGYGWATINARWCTKALKTNILDKYIKEKYKDCVIKQYIGIAFDEQKRIKDKNYPLIDWKMTEADCLQYCYNKGFDWCGLYEKFNRLSCWCCPLQNLKALRVLYKEYPKLWEELKAMDKKANNQFRADYSVEQLEQKFKKELEK